MFLLHAGDAVLKVSSSAPHLNRCPCGTPVESRTRIVGECEIFKEERDALEEEMRIVDVCDMEEFGRLESSEKTIAILGDRW